MKKIVILAAAIAAGHLYANAEEPSAATGAYNDTDSIGATYSELDELVITAKKDVVKSDGAKLTYDLDQDDSSKGQTVLDALKKVPMVTVDGEGNIRIKGDSNFRIYVNGKEDPMLTANASKVLKMMPAESVSKIEVVTEPGAKYDAEGTGGILNLVTERKQTSEGYTASLNASAMTQGFVTAGAYGRMKKNRVTADANVSWFGSPIAENPNDIYTETVSLNDDTNHRQTVRGRQRAGINFIDASLNLSWEPTDRDLISLNGTFRDGKAKITELNPVTTMWSRSGEKQWEYRQDYTGNMTNLGSSGNVSYQHSFNDNGHRLTAAYRFDYGMTEFPLTITNHDLLDYPFFEQSGRDVTHTNSSTYQREHTAQVDYSNPIGNGKHTIETGVKGIFRRNSASGEDYYGTNESTLIPATETWSLTNQIQDVYAVYASYTGQFDMVNLTAGVRYEHSVLGMDFLRGNDKNFRTHLNDVVPNVAITHSMGPATNLRLAYQMRIQRPGLWQLNPYEQTSMPSTVRTGNPDLTSERYNSLNLTYSNFGRVLGGNIGIGYTQTNNSIEEFKRFENGIEYDTYGNFGIKRKAQLSGFLNWNITGSMSLSLNGMVEYTDIKTNNGEGTGNHGWSGNYGANWNYTDPVKIRYTVYGGQSTPTITLQGHSSGYYYYGLSVGRNFLKDDKLNVTLSANNFLQKAITYTSYTETPTHTNYTEMKNRCWNISLSVSWTFGHLAEKVKKSAISLENDDVHSQKGGNGGISL